MSKPAAIIGHYLFNVPLKMFSQINENVIIKDLGVTPYELAATIEFLFRSSLLKHVPKMIRPKKWVTWWDEDVAFDTTSLITEESKMAVSSAQIKNKKIGLTGPIGCGKSTVANILQRHDFKEFAFAEPLKKIVEFVFDIPMQIMMDPDGKMRIWEPRGVTPRELLQKIGTELFRVDIKRMLPDLKLPNGPTPWLNKLITDVANCSNSIVVSDVRFDDEAEHLAKHGFQIILVSRPTATSAASKHSSEAGCKYHKVLDNSSSLDELKKKVEGLIKQ